MPSRVRKTGLGAAVGAGLVGRGWSRYVLQAAAEKLPPLPPQPQPRGQGRLGRQGRRGWGRMEQTPRRQGTR